MSRRVRPLSLSLCLLALAASPASGQTTYTWTGGDPADDGWFSGLNWAGNQNPLNSVGSTAVVLAGTARTANTLDYSFGAAGLTFANSAGPFVVGTTSPTRETLTLGVGGLTVASGNASPQAFNAPLALGAAQTWANNGSRTLTIGGPVDTAGFLLTAAGGGNSVFAGVVSGAGGLTKSGGGTLTLSAANGYTGATAVAGGTLVVNGSLAAGSAVTVAAGGVLAGGGTVNGGVAVAPGGAVRGGVAGTLGTLTVANNVTLTSSAGSNGVFRFEAGRTGPGAAANSRVALAGAGSVLSLNPGSGNKFTLDLVNGASPLLVGEAYSLTVATAAGGVRVNGTPLAANGVVSPSVYALQSASFADFAGVSLTADGTGTALVLSFTPVPAPVPEPAGLLAAAAAALVLARRRRRA